MRGTRRPGGETGPFFRHQGGCGLARLLITLGMRDAGGAAAVDARAAAYPLYPLRPAPGEAPLGR